MKKRILVVDDEATFTKMIRLNLERTGRYEVRTENRGANGLAAAKEFRPDLLFLDIMMPDMAGDDVAQQIREDDDLRDLKIVFLTAIVSREETEVMGTNVGGNEFLAKPVTADDLLETIERVLGE